MVCAPACHAARQNALEKEMEDYARDYYRKHPEAAGDKNKRDAREELVKQAQSDRVLQLSEKQAKMLRRRKDVVTDGSLKTAVGNLKSLNSKDPEIAFLIEYAGQKKLKPAEKLLAHRLAVHRYQKAMAKAAADRTARMQAVMAKYTAYKAANGKAPGSLAELNLPDDCRQFIDPATGKKSDWIYIGHLGARLQAGESFVVLAEPVPLGSSRVCGLDNGKISPFKDSQIKEYLKKLVKAAADGGGAAPAVGAGGNHPGLPALESLMKKYLAYKQRHNNTGPDTLSELELTAGERQYSDPDTGEKSDWIFLGEKSRLKGQDGVALVIVSPKPYKGVRIAGLADGRQVVVADAAISKHLP